MRATVWLPDDARMVSAGEDGAVYEWRIADQRRLRDHVVKVCMPTTPQLCCPSAHHAVMQRCSAGMTLYWQLRVRQPVASMAGQTASGSWHLAAEALKAQTHDCIFG